MRPIRTRGLVPNSTSFSISASQEDISYKTMPDGMPLSSPEGSEVSSLASARNSSVMTDDDNLSGMLRSHSALIQVELGVEF